MFDAPPKEFPPQTQREQKPGVQAQMDPQPECEPRFPGVGKLKDKVALITGGDSGIGRAVAHAFARESADVAILYLADIEKQDADETKRLIESEGRKAMLVQGDVGDPEFVEQAVQQVVHELGKLDIVVSNAAEGEPATEFEDDADNGATEHVFRTNVFGAFNVVRKALPYLKEGASVIVTTSLSGIITDPGPAYSSSKGALQALVKSLSQRLMEKKIRVNSVAPGPVWTPLVPAHEPPEETAQFGQESPMGRAAQPNEIAPCFVFLASEEASYMTGQTLHPNGGSTLSA